MSVYAITIACFAQMPRSLTMLLTKSQERAQALGFDAQNLLDARLAPDMHTLARQVEFTRTQAQEAACRLTRQALPLLATPANLRQARALFPAKSLKALVVQRRHHQFAHKRGIR
ncbi:protein of unknown function [Janthinobacterium sp. OK676]|uniref:DUF1993 family protein n=1 Tax=unclassified Janthinobacterium TaxID=2610881 RepID=UPI000884DD6F|nr:MULTISPECIES: DUF1993 family protein [unclassified Janthinobacterium]PJJ21565.1 uncharacterized protein DUF1993 [Janthinobacterium sp. 67]SDN41400.1 protein of unknown function [Janthinobacterium sp. OK676]